MSQIDNVSFPSGLKIDNPVERLTRVLTEEYDYYDAFLDASPNEIIPLDVFVAAGMNAFYRADAKIFRGIHRGMAAICNPRLQPIPAAEDLTSAADLNPVADIIATSCTERNVQSAVATKILHRKRPNLFPIIDSVMAKHCCVKRDCDVLAGDWTRVDVLQNTIDSFLKVVRNDLVASKRELILIQQSITPLGWPLTTLRIHDLLVWTENEPKGYYR